MSGSAIAKEGDLPKLVGYRQLQSLYGWPKRTVQDWIRARKFPKPLNLPGRTNFWALDDIVAWLRSDLNRVAVTSPDDLSTEQLDAISLDWLKRTVAGLAGEPVEMKNIRIHYAPPLTEDEADAAFNAQLDALEDKFASLDEERSAIVVAWLFPALRSRITWADEATARRMKDPDQRRSLGVNALDGDEPAEPEGEHQQAKCGPRIGGTGNARVVKAD
jgi:predicted DNA-binding transcriptional regulator AlpA